MRFDTGYSFFLLLLFLGAVIFSSEQIQIDVTRTRDCEERSALLQAANAALIKGLEKRGEVTPGNAPRVVAELVPAVEMIGPGEAFVKFAHGETKIATCAVAEGSASRWSAIGVEYFAGAKSLASGTSTKIRSHRENRQERTAARSAHMSVLVIHPASFR